MVTEYVNKEPYFVYYTVDSIPVVDSLKMSEFIMFLKNFCYIILVCDAAHDKGDIFG